MIILIYESQFGCAANNANIKQTFVFPHFGQVAENGVRRCVHVCSESGSVFHLLKVVCLSSNCNVVLFYVTLSESSLLFSLDVKPQYFHCFEFILT